MWHESSLIICNIQLDAMGGVYHQIGTRELTDNLNMYSTGG